MNDTTPQTEILPPAPKQISVSTRLVKGIAFTLVIMLAIAGTTIGTITMFQLNTTRHQLSQTQSQLSTTQGQLSTAQTQLGTAQAQLSCMEPTIDYLSQFNGWFSQVGNDGDTWYSPATNGRPTASSNMKSCG